MPNGASPYVEFTADGTTGSFLPDYGAIRSSAAAAGTDRSQNQEFRFQTLKAQIFHLARYDLLLHPKKG